jgi:hypothetical protein
MYKKNPNLLHLATHSSFTPLSRRPTSQLPRSREVAEPHPPWLASCLHRQGRRRQGASRWCQSEHINEHRRHSASLASPLVTSLLASPLVASSPCRPASPRRRRHTTSSPRERRTASPWRTRRGSSTQYCRELGPFPLIGWQRLAGTGTGGDRGGDGGVIPDRPRRHLELHS